jgi:hypothetical protein
MRSIASQKAQISFSAIMVKSGKEFQATSLSATKRAQMVAVVFRKQHQSKKLLTLKKTTISISF